MNIFVLLYLLKTIFRPDHYISYANKKQWTCTLGVCLHTLTHSGMPAVHCLTCVAHITQGRQLCIEIWFVLKVLIITALRRPGRVVGSACTPYTVQAVYSPQPPRCQKKRKKHTIRIKNNHNNLFCCPSVVKNKTCSLIVLCLF